MRYAKLKRKNKAPNNEIIILGLSLFQTNKQIENKKIN